MSVKGTGKVSAISSWGKLLGKQNRSPSTWQVFSLVSPHLGPSLFPSPSLSPLFLCCWPCSSWRSPTFWHSPGCCSRLLYKLWGVLAWCLLARLVVLYAWKEHNLIYMFILRELPQFVAFVGVSSSFVCLSHMSLPRGNPRPVLGFAGLLLWASLAKSCRIVQVANFIVCPKALSRFLIGHSRG